MYHKRVGKQIGTNPVARAVARKALDESITKHKIRLYLTNKGEPCADFCTSIGTVLSVLAYAAELSGRGDDPLVRILRGAISACVQMADADAYDPINTVALDRALDAAVELNATLKPELITRAWNTLHSAGG